MNQGMGGALLLEPDGTSGPDCHRRILDMAAGLLTWAQRHGTARADLTADDLLQLVVGIALSTAHGEDRPARPDRLLDLVLDAVHTPPRRDK
ncbi:hypothetical protein O1L60_39150 [Streptomyces diastatochromogenes]|nr:hypothetical protein [Streptomyces diastatochromogenes]